MKKSMYSLMLSDEVVSAIDRLAYEGGTNRSNLVNRILAEYVSYRTPEMRMKDMLAQIEHLLAPRENLQTMLRQSGAMLDLRSALVFKYNPTVYYSVELYRVPSPAVGELKVSLRTQNSNLLLYMMQFYKLWAKIEQSYMGYCNCVVEDGKLTRRLTPGRAGNEEAAEQEICRAIVDYVSAFDEALKAFFYNLADGLTAARQVENVYKRYMALSAITV